MIDKLLAKCVLGLLRNEFTAPATHRGWVRREKTSAVRMIWLTMEDVLNQTGAGRHRSAARARLATRLPTHRE